MSVEGSGPSPQPGAAACADGAPPGARSSGLAGLAPLCVAGRVCRVRERLAERGVDAVVVTEPVNIRWLTGFAGSNGTVVISAAGALLVTDGRYADQAPAQLAQAGCFDDVEVVIARSAPEAVAGRLGAVALLGLEDSIAWRDQRLWAAAVDAEIEPLEGLIEELRAVKDSEEVARIEAAARIADLALADVLPLLRPGSTELGVRQALDDALRAGGASGPAYDTIVASGPNSALPHALAEGREMMEGDLVVVDVGAVVDGYRSDMTRTFVLGEPSEQAAAMIDAVSRSQAAGVAAVRPGEEAAEIDRTCRSVLEEAGMGDAFVHGTGHGVGLDIHELPRISSASTAILRPGHVITVEPGVYFAGVGGARVEDLLLVTDDGCRPLTQHPKDPVMLRWA